MLLKWTCFILTHLILSVDSVDERRSVNTVLSCPEKTVINTCHWNAPNRFRDSDIIPIQKDEKPDPELAFFFNFGKFGPSKPFEKFLLMQSSNFISSETNKILSFEFVTACWNYTLWVCSDVESHMPCAEFYLEKNSFFKVITKSVPIPRTASQITLYASSKNSTWSCNEYWPVHLGFQSFTVSDDPNPRDNENEDGKGGSQIPVELETFRKLKNMTTSFDQFENKNTDKCISDPENQLKYNDLVGMNGFFAYPFIQWIFLNGTALNQKFKFLYGGGTFFKLPDTKLLAIQLTPHRKWSSLISNPIPCIEGSTDDTNARLVLKFWSSPNVALTLCIRSHVTDEVLSCFTKKSYEFSFENDYSVADFFMPTIRWTFELRLIIETKAEKESGFLILKSIDFEGKVCSNQCNTETNLKTLSKMTNAHRIITCPSTSRGTEKCHWFAPQRFTAAIHAFTFLFVNNGTYSNYSEFPFLYTRYFEAAPGRSLLFGYTATCEDFMVEVCFARAISVKFQKEKYEALPCKKYIIQESLMNNDNKGLEPIPPTANRIYIAATPFGDPPNRSCAVSIYDMGVHVEVQSDDYLN